ncbi:hypothetical protein Ancab_037445 [Ancistrocladus abbreviatus]
MDKFGALVQQFGIKPQGKSAPMSARKEPIKTHDSENTPNLYPGFDSKPFSNISKSTSNSHSVSGESLLDDQSNLFWSKSGHRNYGSSGGFDDVFQSSLKNPDFLDNTSVADTGLGFDLESIFKGRSMNLKSKFSFSSTKDGATIGDDIGDILSGFPSTRSDATNNDNDLLSSIDPVDDFLDNLGKMEAGSMGSTGKSLDETNKNKLESNDLIPGFDRMPEMNNSDRVHVSSTEKDFGVSSIDELENFAMGRIWKNANGHSDVEAKGQWETDFIVIDESSDNGSLREAKEMKIPSMPDEANRSSIKSEVVPDLFSGTSSSMETVFWGKHITDDLFPFFGAGPPFGEVKEFEEENEGRRRARFGRYQRTQERMARALADMNEREWQAQQEQEERRRIADILDVKMKCWAAGKEGNLRALLSDLQRVLWPECGWQPVSLSDLITSSQVKIAYKKAALCVHPDKVQQKGANLHQKYVAEKVFDLLKEAWNKFNSEELR